MESRKEGRQDIFVLVNMYSGTIQIWTSESWSETERSFAHRWIFYNQAALTRALGRNLAIAAALVRRNGEAGLPALNMVYKLRRCVAVKPAYYWIEILGRTIENRALSSPTIPTNRSASTKQLFSHSQGCH